MFHAQISTIEKNRVVSDKEDVIQTLVVLQLTYRLFKFITIAGTLVLLQELVFKMLKILNAQMCVILINKINRHYCFYIQFMIWVYDD